MKNIDMPVPSHRFLPHTDADVKLMLERCGANSLADLYNDVPESLLLNRDYNLPEAMSEPEVREYFNALGAKNTTLKCFAGAGFYNHYTPAAVNAILARSEFLTAYTPYQPEVSQGTLQYIFEYQSIMAELTGMEVSNASMYDGATATAEAMMMAVAAGRKRNRVAISATLNPAVAQVCHTYARYHGIDIDIIPEVDGATDLNALDAILDKGDVAGVIVATPNYYGVLENFDGLADKVHARKALLVVNAPASPLSVIATPGQIGADIAAGDAQSLGMPLNFGGPYLGYLCCNRSLMRKLPGRVVGATTDASGKRVFVLTLQAREQHIRREKATSNICSNQGLMALHTAVYVSLMGPEGLRRVNQLSYGAAHQLADELVKTGKMQLAFPNRPFFNEVLLTTVAPLTADTVIEACLQHGILAGVKVDHDKLLVAATELNSPADIQLYSSIVKSL